MLSDALEGTGATFLRVMPNTPAMVGEGMTALCEEYTLSEEDFSFAQGIFEALGRTVVLPERLFDGVIALSGSSPAYVYMLIEAMMQGGVQQGIPKDIAIQMAAQSVLLTVFRTVFFTSLSTLAYYVAPVGLEPDASGLKGRRLIQLD